MKNSTTITSQDTAATLESAYVWSVNCAVASGSTGLATELANTYQREIHELNERDAEIERLRAA